MSLYAKLQQRAADRQPVRIGLIGAGKFGSMYLAQVPRIPGVHLAGIAVPFSAPERDTTVTRSVRVSRRGFTSSTCRPAIEKRRRRRSISSVLPQNMQPAITWTQPCV